MFNGDKANFNLKKFDLSNIIDHATIVIIASRGSGKSFLLREILYEKRNIPCVVIAPTDRMNGFYSDFVPSSYVHYEYSSELLSRILKRQINIIEKNKQRIKLGKKPIEARLFLVMDDCLASKNLWDKDPNIAEIMQNGRHYYLTVAICLQFSLGMNPSMRSNFDYVFLLGEDFISNQKRLFDHYAGMFPSFDIFKRVFGKVCTNFGCMVINNRKKGGDIQDKVFWYRANQTPAFTMGSKSYITFHKQHYKKDWNKVEKQFDVDEFLNKKNKVNIDVKLDKA